MRHVLKAVGVRLAGRMLLASLRFSVSSGASMLIAALIGVGIGSLVKEVPPFMLPQTAFMSGAYVAVIAAVAIWTTYATLRDLREFGSPMDMQMGLLGYIDMYHEHARYASPLGLVRMTLKAIRVRLPRRPKMILLA